MNAIYEPIFSRYQVGPRTDRSDTWAAADILSTLPRESARKGAKGAVWWLSELMPTCLTLTIAWLF